MERIVIYLVLLNACFDINIALKRKHIMDKLDYIEDRLNAESIRLNAESKFRKEGFNILLDKVVGMELKLNKLLEKKEIDSASSAISDKTMSDISSNKMITTLLKSFEAEKFENRRFKRDILQDVYTQARQTKEANDRVENSLDNISKEIGHLKQETHQLKIDLDKVAKNTTSLLYSTLQKTETILVYLNGTTELIKDQEHLHEITQTQLEHSRFVCQNDTRSLSKNLEVILKLMRKYESCLDLYNSGVRLDGIYTIQITPSKTDISVYCDMTTDGGGWTVFQRRQDGSEDFRRDWNDYKHGFGKLDGEFWLGNEYMNLLTDDGKIHELRVDLEDYEGDRAYAKYNKFKIGPESTNYTLEVSGYTGNAGDSLNNQYYEPHNHNGMQFTTKDRDNDLHSGYNCASNHKGAWWFNYCFSSHLNGVYIKQKKCPSLTSCIIWSKWKGFRNTMKFSEMKLR